MYTQYLVQFGTVDVFGALGQTTNQKLLNSKIETDK